MVKIGMTIFGPNKLIRFFIKRKRFSRKKNMKERIDKHIELDIHLCEKKYLVVTW